MKIGIISDTHDKVERIKKAIETFNEEKVSIVFHCGDIVSPFVLQYFKELKCPIKFLFGNNAGDIFLHLQVAKRLGLNADFSNFYSLTIENRKIAIYHGDVPEITEALINCGKYDCVFVGHEHIAKIERYGKVLFVNPGSLAEKHKEGMRPSIAIYDTHTHDAKIIYLEE